MESLSDLKDKDPIQIFENWLKSAEEALEVKEASAMVLSSIMHSGSSNRDFKVSSRVVLLKEVHEGNLIFYTNYKSPKAYQLRKKHKSALNFYWPALGKQVRMEGITAKIPRDKSVQYWKTRPQKSQISQYISEQSEKLESRTVLKKKWEEAQRKFYEKQVPCPDDWGGFGFTPLLIEFWLEKPHRLHDRIVFKKKFFGMLLKQKWVSHLLYP